ncbi:actin-depolymerizing factor 10 [Quercus suber]|uniref:Actin-depolymerizing factor 10 n=1 Tax=Quercus suber TaxID=58331 RepID=A0AAW0L1F0_QUESU
MNQGYLLKHAQQGPAIIDSIAIGSILKSSCLEVLFKKRTPQIPQESTEYPTLIFIHTRGHLDTSKVRSKVVYATSKDRFKRDLDMDDTPVMSQATNPSKMSLDIVKGQELCHFTFLMFSSS